MFAAVSAGPWAVGLLVVAFQPLEPVKPHYDCTWSPAWESVASSASGPGELTPPRKRKGSLARPRPNPGERYSLEGPWIVSAVVDADGKVVDAKILRSASEPRWPQYEASLLKSLRKWKFAPASRNGRSVPFCFTLSAQDR
jgi:TonB family protein